MPQAAQDHVEISHAEDWNPMILATMRMIVQPDKRDEFGNTVRAMLEPVALEPGCISFRFYQDVGRNNAFIFVEEWKTEQDLKNHLRTDGFRIILALADLLSVEAPEIKFHEISSTSGMEAIGAALGRTV